MRIGDHAVGPGEPVFIAAELGITAMGDVDRACALVDAVAAAGAQAAKFILTDPDKVMSRRDVPFRYLTPHGVATRPLYDLLAECRFTPDEWRLLREYCRAQGVVFFATTDYIDGVAFLETLDVPAHKLSAWDIAYDPLRRAMRATGKPLLIDVGTATREEVLHALPDDPNLLFVHDPHPPDWTMQRVAGLFRPEYAVGFSSPGRESWCDYVALGGGVCYLEKRLTVRRDEPRGHHHAISLEPAEFAAWVKAIRAAERTIRQDPFTGTPEAWAQRRQFDRDETGRQK